MGDAGSGRGTAIVRQTTRNRLPRRTRPEEQYDYNEQGDGQDDEKNAEASHARRLTRRRPADNRRLAPPGWIERNRTWFIPYISAILVVAIEIVAAFTKPLPESAHLVLAAFWGFAVQRGVRRQKESVELEHRIAEYAAKHRLPVEYVRDEFTVFTSSLRQLPPGDHHDHE